MISKNNVFLRVYDMKIYKTKCYLLVVILFLFLATFCKNSEDEKKQYEGFSNLVKERREANEKYKKTPTGNLNKNKSVDKGTTSGIKRRNNKTVDVVIKDVANGNVIVYGTAFFDENGKLINIKITQD